MRPDANLARPDPLIWSLQMIIILIWAGAVMRLILIWSGGGPPHVQLWEFFKITKGALKNL